MFSKSGIGKMVAVVLAIIIIVAVVAAAYVAISLSPSPSPSASPTPTPKPTATATPTPTPTVTPTPTSTPKPTPAPTPAPTPTPTPTDTGKITPTFTLSRNGTITRPGDIVILTGTLKNPDTGATLPISGNVGLVYTVTSVEETIGDTEIHPMVNGVFTYPYRIDAFVRYTFQLSWSGDDTTNPALSNVITVNVFNPA